MSNYPEGMTAVDWRYLEGLPPVPQSFERFCRREGLDESHSESFWLDYLNKRRRQPWIDWYDWFKELTQRQIEKIEEGY